MHQQLTQPALEEVMWGWEMFSSVEKQAEPGQLEAP